MEGGLGCEQEGSWFESQCRQNLEDALIVGRGAKTPSNHCPGALEQSAGPTNAHEGPRDKLGTNSGGPAFTHAPAL